ncbi:MAG: hypothetical protein PHI18_03865 [bacterium]|nr:hypothetical protein [bacterium]
MVDFFGENTGLYFYSAVFQGNMALLGLLGVIVVFKLQHLSGWIDNIDEAIILYAQDKLEENRLVTGHIPLACYNAHDLRKFLGKISKDEKNYSVEIRASARHLLEGDAFVGQMLNTRKNAVSMRATTVRKATIPFILTGLAACLSLGLLMLSHQVHYYSTGVEACVFSAVFLLSCGAIWSDVSFAVLSLGRDKHPAHKGDTKSESESERRSETAASAGSRKVVSTVGCDSLDRLGWPHFADGDCQSSGRPAHIS